MTLQCRTCATSAAIEFLHIFEPESKYAPEMQEVLDELRYRWNLEVEADDKLPQHICNICFHEFSVYFHFKQNCLAAQQELYVTIAQRGTTIKQDIDHINQRNSVEELNRLTDKIQPVNAIDPRETTNSFQRPGKPTAEIAQHSHPQNSTPTPASNENLIKSYATNSPGESLTSSAQQSLEHVLPDYGEEKFIEDPYLENINDGESDAAQVNDADEKLSIKTENLEEVFIEFTDNTNQSSNASFGNLELSRSWTATPQDIFEGLADNSCENDDTDSEFTADDHDFDVLKRSKRKRERTKEQNEIYCEFCYYQRSERNNRKPFRNQEELELHIAATHPKDKPYNCPLCSDRSYKETNARNQHIRHAHNNRRFLCELCGKMVMPGGLKSHMEIFHMYGDYTCKICGAEFKDMSLRTFRYHQRWHDPKKQYKCDQCDRIFVQSTKYQEHMARHNKTGTKVCNYCEKRFVDIASLNHHLYTAHAGEKPEKCNYCERRFTTYKQKITHMTLNHGYEIKGRTDSCRFCGKFITNKSKHKCKNSVNYKPNYRRQILTVDCKICFKFFSTEENLMKHMRIHSSEGRPFSCTICELHFKTKRNLVVHNTLLHDTSEKPFACEYCDKTFRLKHLVKTHMKLHLDGAKSERCRVKRFKDDEILAENPITEEIITGKTSTKNLKDETKRNPIKEEYEKSVDGDGDEEENEHLLMFAVETLVEV